MPVTPLTIKRGDPITASWLQEVSDRATGLFKSYSGSDIKIDVSAGGISIMGKRVLSYNQPGVIAEWENIDSVDFEPFDVVQLTEPIQVQSASNADMKVGTPMNEDTTETFSILQATIPRDYHFGRFGICLDAIGQGEVGRGWLSGVTFCKVARLHGVYAESRYIKKPDRADTVRGQTYLQMSHVGAAQVLWIMEPLNPEWDARPAIVSFDHRNTTGIGLYEWGNDFNGGIAEVLEFNDAVTIVKTIPGGVRISR